MRCPACLGGPVTLGSGPEAATCANCHQTYPSIFGIPNLTTENKSSDLYVDVERHNRSAVHYSQKPLHHFFDLETSPIGKYLRQGLFRKDLAVFEIGCGTGTIAEIIQQKAGCNICGVDLAPGSIVQARRLGIPLLLASNINLPLQEDVSDLTISNGVIHHTPNPRQCLAELARITKPDGRIILVVHRKYSFYWIWFLLYSSICKTLLRLLGQRMGNIAVFSFYALFYYLPFWLGRALYHRKISPPGVREVWLTFNDQFMSPTCTFHTFDEIDGWASKMKLRLIESFNFVRPGGGAISFLFKKER